MTRVLFFTSIVFFCFDSFAQNDCSENLNKARQLFDEGFIEDLPSLLIPCLEEGFSREEKISAYKLLILAYIFDDNQNEAEIVVLSFFSDFPNYEVRTDDPAEFIYLLESYEAVPVYSLYGGMGLNQSIVQIKEVRSTSPSPGSNSVKFGKTGYNLLFGTSYNLSEYVKNLGINVRLQFSQYNFDFEEINENTSKTKYEERQTRINIPLFLSYNLSDFFPESTLQPEVYLGSNFEFVTSTKGTPNIDNFTNSETGLEDDIRLRRRIYEPSLFFGMNYSYPLTKGSIFFDINTKIGFFELQKKGLSYNDNNLYKFLHIDDKFILHNLFFNVGYRYTFYKPTKIR